MMDTTDRAEGAPLGPDDILNAPQVADLLGVSPSQVVNYIAGAGLPATNIGSPAKPRWALLRKHVAAWAATRPPTRPRRP